MELLDKDSTAVSEVIHHRFVMNNLVANVNRTSEDFECAVDDIDRAINTGTKPARVGKHHCHQCNSAGSTRSIFTSNLRVRPASG